MVGESPKRGFSNFGLIIPGIFERVLKIFEHNSFRDSLKICVRDRASFDQKKIVRKWVRRRPISRHVYHL